MRTHRGRSSRAGSTPLTRADDAVCACAECSLFSSRWPQRVSCASCSGRLRAAGGCTAAASGVAGLRGGPARGSEESVRGGGREAGTHNDTRSFAGPSAITAPAHSTASGRVAKPGSAVHGDDLPPALCAGLCVCVCVCVCVYARERGAVRVLRSRGAPMLCAGLFPVGDPACCWS